MSSNTRKSGITLSALATEFRTFATAQTEHNEAVNAILLTITGGTTKPATTKAGKGKKAKAKVTTTGPTFPENQQALRALKAEGKAPAGMTVAQAVEAGLLPPTVQPVREPKVVTTKVAKVATATKATEGTPFGVLKAALKAHKASGAVPAQHNGTFVTVKSAIADGLMNADGTLPGKGKKASKKAKGAQVVAVVADTTPARNVSHVAADAPRRADGTITPKREWALREQLALTGKYDRNQIDKKVAKAMKVLDA